MSFSLKAHALHYNWKWNGPTNKLLDGTIRHGQKLKRMRWNGWPKLHGKTGTLWRLKLRPNELPSCILNVSITWTRKSVPKGLILNRSDNTNLLCLGLGQHEKTKSYYRWSIVLLLIIQLVGRKVSSLTYFKIASFLVASYMPDRNRVQCETRYNRSLNPNLVHGRWTEEEDMVNLQNNFKISHIFSCWLHALTNMDHTTGRGLLNRCLVARTFNVVQGEHFLSKITDWILILDGSTIWTTKEVKRHGLSMKTRQFWSEFKCLGAPISQASQNCCLAGTQVLLKFEFALSFAGKSS